MSKKRKVWDDEKLCKFYAKMCLVCCEIRCKFDERSLYCISIGGVRA